MTLSPEITITSSDISLTRALSREAARLIIVELDFTIRSDIENGTDWAIDNYLRQMTANESVNHSLVQQDTLVATSFVRYGLPAKKQTCAQIDAIAVHKDLQRNGYGRMLVHLIAAQAADNGDDHVRLMPYNKNLEEPYKRLGFSVDDDPAYFSATPAEILATY